MSTCGTAAEAVTCNQKFIVSETSPTADFCIPAWGNVEVEIDMTGDIDFNKATNTYDYQLFRATINNNIPNSKIKLNVGHYLLDSPTSSTITLKEAGQYIMMGTFYNGNINWRISRFESPTFALSA